ncbi:MAG: helix-turn-helix transcriptional regulator [Lachnospiraceae bacterium]|nr:helix-turn-helix transcriptional regulator [Lachnospiraceae bacterium]
MKDRIKTIRKNNKMTQVEFGNKIGVKGNTITGYETGLRTPSDAVIFSICREFNISEDWLRYGKGEMINENEQISLDDFAKSHNMTDIDKEIIMCYLSIPSNLRNSLISYVKDYFSIEQKPKTSTDEIAAELISAEEEYIKSNLNSVRKTGYPASNSINDTERKVN